MDSKFQDDDDFRALNQRVVELLKAGRFGDATPLAMQFLELTKVRHWEDHPQHAIVLNLLARMLYGRKQLAEAEPLMRRAISLLEKTVGAEHPYVGGALTNLAELLLHTNRSAEAEPLMRRVITILEHSLGAEQPDFARDLRNLARLIEDTNRLAEAVPLMRRMLAIVSESQSDVRFALGGAPQEEEEEEEAEGRTKPAPPKSLQRPAPTSHAAQAPRQPTSTPPAAKIPRARLLERQRRYAFAPPDCPDPSTPQGALEIEAGRLAYQIPKRMWLGVQETVEVRLGRLEAQGLMQGFVGRGEVRAEATPIVETMCQCRWCASPAHSTLSLGRRRISWSSPILS